MTFLFWHRKPGSTDPFFHKKTNTIFCWAFCTWMKMAAKKQTCFFKPKLHLQQLRYNHFSPSEFFTPTFADDLSMETEWQQVFSGLLDSIYLLSDLNNSVDWMVLILPLLFTPFRVFHSRVSWWLHTSVWATASLQDLYQYSGRF